MLSHYLRTLGAACMLLAASFAATVQAQDLRVTIDNLSEPGGLFLTPLWFGFHDGSFDLYDAGSPATAGLEQIAEDGVPATLQSEFAAATSSSGGQDGVVFGPGGFGSMAGQPPVIDAGETASATIAVNPTNRYFSYASMVIPSNDAFIANGNPLAHQAFDAAGNFTPLDILVLGSQVLDSGTEVNTEMDAAFINQAMDGDGTSEGGSVGLHSGFIGSVGNPGGTPIILGGTNAAGFDIDALAADFTRAGFQVARITVSQVPEPSSLVLVGIMLVSLGVLGRRQRS